MSMDHSCNRVMQGAQFVREGKRRDGKLVV
jgi:hypothetical protein